MSRIRSVQFTESPLFTEVTPIFPPINDANPLYGPTFQAAAPDPIKAVDPLSGSTHRYSDCYAGWGRWELDDIIVTNASSNFVQWSLYRMPPGTYKFTTNHNFYRYSSNPPGGNPQDVSLSVNPNFQALLYNQPLRPGQTFHPSHFRALVNSGDSLWATAVPGYPFGTVSSTAPVITMRLFGDIVV